ncbi:hypothetical protein TNCV_3321621 [Trichonephila clavipes]|nr:hypothetical protein TNCV_3321621 [Trichonephila clavipes]
MQCRIIWCRDQDFKLFFFATSFGERWEAAGPQDTIAVFTFALFTGNGFLRNLGVPQVNGLYGGRSCILAQLVGQSEL